MKSDKSQSLFFLFFAIFSVFRIVNMQKLSPGEQDITLWAYPALGWFLFLAIFWTCTAFLKDKYAIMKKLDEKGKIILFVLTLVLANDYLFFLTVRMSTQMGIVSPLDPLEWAIGYIIIIVTAIAAIYFIYRLLRKEKN